ncbi:MAG TPA: sigma 54-interacting transcriptional regulator [Polyangiaceae bacterium]|nr:sigma 54-interacting transcriptional regulator [Polyangiaceae bacterium]
MKDTETVLGTFRRAVTGGSLKYGLRSLDVGEHPVNIGRGETCDLQVDDPLVSTRHCELSAAPDGILVRDLGSKNGTFVSELKLVPHQSVIILRTAKLTVGETVLEVAPREDKDAQELSPTFGIFETRTTQQMRVFNHMHRCAKTNLPILLQGETGTGKTYFARVIHDHSPRAGRPFRTLDCSNIPEGLAESTLFGHKRGAFTGATSQKRSLFVDADGGTLFLDEVGQLPPNVQAKLLRVIAEGIIVPVGSDEEIRVDVRLIAATLDVLEERVNRGTFREDLYSRLSAVTITLPPLRERPEDIETITKRILINLNREDAIDKIDADTFEWLKKRSWSRGNVRELFQHLQLAVEFSHGSDLDIKNVIAGSAEERRPMKLSSAEVDDIVYDALVAGGLEHEAVKFEALRRLVMRQARDTNMNISDMSRRTGMARNTLREIMDKMGIRDPARNRKKDSP